MALQTPTDLFVYEMGNTRRLELDGDVLLSNIGNRIQNEGLAQFMHQEEEARHERSSNLDSCMQSIGAWPVDFGDPIIAGLQLRFEHLCALRPARNVMDLFALGIALRVELLGIAAYRELTNLAELLGEDYCRRILQSNLVHKEEYLGGLQRHAYQMTVGMPVPGLA